MPLSGKICGRWVVFEERLVRVNQERFKWVARVKSNNSNDCGNNNDDSDDFHKDGNYNDDNADDNDKKDSDDYSDNDNYSHDYDDHIMWC